ncbi:MAG TPA: hypothetical protein VH834_22855 [Solirubrobacteraceae bacterium]|jgi:hypothetical protein
MSNLEGALTRPRIAAPTLGIIGLVVALVIVFAGNYHVESGENGGTGPAIITGVVCLALTLALFGYVVPRATNLDRTALILAIVAVVSVLVFWSGVTPVLTAAALAVSGRAPVAPPRRVVAAEALAAVATLAAVIITLSQSHLF